MSRDTHRQGEEISKAPSAMADQELQSAKVTLSGASEPVTFEGMGLEPMADTLYRVSVAGEFVGVTVADESTLAVDGFTIIGGASGEVAHVFVHGKIASR